jgi:selenocysteine lyase/cysteine desulfurase
VNRRSFFGRVISSLSATALVSESVKAATFTEFSASKSGKPGLADIWKIISEQFDFEPGLTYLNNGSLGASPRIVHDATNEFRRVLDRFPSKYMWQEWWDDREKVRSSTAAFLSAEPDEIALTHNTCEGLNLVASSLNFQPGDEIIASNHEHHTGVVPLQHYQESKGVKLVRPVLPLLPDSRGELMDVFRKAISRRTRAILVSHIVNTNGMIMPIEELAEIANQHNILLIVDGAQSVGMIPVNLHQLGCDFYAASGHKWLFGPKGTGVFYVRKQSLQHLKPLIVSAAYYKEDNARKFENYNTRNVPEVLGFGVSLDYQMMVGEAERYARVLHLKRYLRNKVAENNFLRSVSPASDDLSAGIQAVEIVGADAQSVAKKLDEEFGINCRPMKVHGLNALRISTAIYNLESDIDYLINSLQEIRQTL